LPLERRAFSPLAGFTLAELLRACAAYAAFHRDMPGLLNV
jgi:hypothetical protein